MSKTQRRRKLSSAGWAKESPGTHERTVMKKQCGSKCFLGPTNESCFPICAKGTCKINTKGIYAAYVRAREYGSKKMHRRSSTKRSSTMRSSTKRSSTKRSSIRSGTKKHKRSGHSHTKKLYQSIAAKAKHMLKKRGFGPNLK
jgi:hypothetical protein